MRHPRHFYPSLWIALLFLPGYALANVQVYPTRLMLNETTRVTALSVRHIGDKTARYSIKAVFYRMKPDGSVEEVPDPQDSERPAVKLIRFSPREITLAPHAEQVIRVLYSGPRNLPEGEYRAHLHIVPADDATPDKVTSVKSGSVTMKLEAKFAVAVPVIYRQGNPHFSASLSNLQLVQTPDHQPAFSLDLASQGNAFAFGDFQIFFVPKTTAEKETLGESGKRSQVSIGVVRSVASYVNARRVVYPLSPPAGLKLTDGVLRAEFREPEDKGGKLIQAIETPLK